MSVSELTRDQIYRLVYETSSVIGEFEVYTRGVMDALKAGEIDPETANHLVQDYSKNIYPTFAHVYEQAIANVTL